MYYGTEILRNAGFSTRAALIGNIANGVISVLATFVGIWLLGRVGRRPILLGGQIGTTLSLLMIGILSLTIPESALFPYLILSLTVTFLAFQQGAISPVMWLMVSEIFPLHVRGLGVGIAVFFSWVVNFMVGLTFPVLLETFGLSTFFLFVGFGAISITLVKIYLPETKDRSLEQLEHFFQNHYEKSKTVIPDSGVQS